MKELTVQKARHQMDQLLREVNNDIDYILIKCKSGNGVLVSENLWTAISPAKPVCCTPPDQNDHS